MEKGQIINNQYQIVDKIGDGGFATVYKTWDHMLRKFVAIKKIHKEYCVDAKFVDMFQKEAVNTAKIEHENVVRVINFIRDEHNGAYIIMDYVRGIDLRYLIDKCKREFIIIPHEYLLYIMLEIIKGLDSAHAVKDEITGEPLNIVHCDISPGNIMLYFDGRVKLTDFGIARCGESQIKASAKGKLRGKISYMSPEQARGDDIDRRSDLFGCGIIIYELLTGEKAFIGDTELDILQKVKAVDINFKKLKDVWVPDDIQKIIRKALQKSSDKRYQSASEMFTEIKRYLNKGKTKEEQKKAYIQFITENLKDEIKPEEKIPEDLRVEKVPKPGLPSDSISIASGPVEAIAEGKEKTVFDFVLDTAKRHKKIFISAMVSVIVAFIIYSVIDTFAQFTAWGVKINNIIWPPAFMVDSIPSGARIELIKDNIDIIEQEGYRTITPSNISKILPGIYTLKLFKDGYGEIVRKITVFGKQKGDQKISIAGAKVVGDVFYIPFEVILEVNSTPPEATLFINNKKIGKMPFRTSLEIDKYNIRLMKDGFEVLGGEVRDGACVLDLSKPLSKHRKIDRRFWYIKETMTKKEGKRFLLHGTLWKNFHITSVPPEASVYLHDLPDKVGVTPLSNLPLTAGKHTIRIEKSGYETWERVIDVDAEIKRDLNVALKKEITIFAYEKGKPAKDIRANISIRGTDIKGKTSLRVALPHGKYTFVFKKDRYNSIVITRDVEKMKRKLSVEMELSDPYLKIIVKDFDTGRGVKDAMLWINDSYWKKTNRSGIASGYIRQRPGEFKIEIKAGKYDDFKKAIYIDRGERKTLNVKIGYLRNNIIVVDTAEVLDDASIYINDEYVGKGVQHIYNVVGIQHTLKIKSEELYKEILKDVKISESNQLVFLKLVGKDPLISLEELDFLDKNYYAVTFLRKTKRRVEGILDEKPHHSGTIKILENLNKKLIEMESEKTRLLEKGDNLFKKNKPGEAIRCYEIVLIIDEGNFKAKQRLEELREKRQRFEQEKRDKELLEKVAKYYKDGMSFYRNEAYEEALSSLEKGKKEAKNWGNEKWMEKLSIGIKRTKKKLADKHYMLGYEFYQENKLKEALKEYEEALSYDPSKLEVKEKIAEINKRLQVSITKADNLYNEVLTEYPAKDIKKLIKYYERGKDKKDIEKVGKAIQYYEKVLLINKDDIEAKQGIQRAEQKIKEIVRRKKEVEEHVEQKGRITRLKQSVIRHYEKGMKNYNRESYEQALRNYRSGLSVAKKLGDFSWIKKLNKRISKTKKKLTDKYYMLGYKFFQGNKFEESLKEFRKVVFYDPKNMEVKRKIREVEERIIQINKRKTERLYNDGLTEYSAGNIEKAIELWQQSLKYDSGHRKTQKALERAKAEMKIKD